MANSIKIDGRKLAGVISESGLSQIDLAEKIGVISTTVSRWKAKGTCVVKRTNLTRMAEAFGIPAADFIARVSVNGTGAGSPGLTDAEQEILDAYRALCPRDKAKAFLRFEEMLNQLND